MRGNGSIIGVRNVPKGNITKGVWSLADASLGRLDASWPASSPLIDYNAGTFSSWTTGSAPNVINVGPAHGKGGTAFIGGVLAPSGKVILVPYSSTNIGIYDPVANTYTDGPVHGKGGSAFSGGVLTPNGNIILVPYKSANIGIYDPVANTYTDGPAHGKSNAFNGGVLTPSGNVILVPFGSANIGIYDPVANTYENGPADGAGSFIGGVLTPNNKVIFIPHFATNVGIYDVENNLYSNGPAHGRGNYAYQTGSITADGSKVILGSHVAPTGIYDIASNTLSDGPSFSATYGVILTPSGKMIMINRNGTAAIYDPLTNTLVNATGAVGPGGGSSNCSGGVLTFSGDVVMVPHDHPNIHIISGGASVPTSTDTALTGPYLNKF